MATMAPAGGAIRPDTTRRMAAASAITLVRAKRPPVVSAIFWAR